MNLHLPSPELETLQNEQVEQALLGAILHENSSYSAVAHFLRPDHFFQEVHASTYQVLAQLIEQGIPADLSTAVTYLGDLDLRGITLREYLARIIAEAVTLNAEGYGRIIVDLWSRRRLAALAEGLLASVRALPHDEQVSCHIRNAQEQLAELGESASALGQSPQPVDPWGRFDPPDLVRGLLPSVIEDFAAAKGEIMGADPSGLAMAALAVCTAAMPDCVKLKVKKYDNWVESPRIWVALVGDPSSKKSPILKAASAPISELERQLHQKYLAAMRAYEALPPHEKDGTEPPKHMCIWLGDTTIEAAQEVLRHNPDGVICFRDELSGWWGSMGKYSGGASANDKAFWMESHNGGFYRGQRLGRGHFVLENLSVNILGGIQPDLARRFARDASDDGLVQRLVPVILRPATVSKDEPPKVDVQLYFDVVQRLRHFLPAGDVMELELSDAAHEVRQSLERKHIELQSLQIVSTKLGSHIGKYDGLLARLCIVWHCLKHVNSMKMPNVISGETAHTVGRFIHEFLLPHAVAFYVNVLGLSGQDELMQALSGYILSRKLRVITFRDVERADRVLRRLDKRQIRELFLRMEALGWLYEGTKRESSRAPRWYVNPECHRRFLDRASSEAQRRQSAKLAIAQVAGAQTLL